MRTNEAVMASQDAVFEAAIELARVNRRLAQIATSLPLPADVDDLFEDRVPSIPAVHLYGLIGAVTDELRETVAVLLEAAQIDGVALRREFRNWEGRRS
jgi:hypothetical protein